MLSVLYFMWCFHSHVLLLMFGCNYPCHSCTHHSLTRTQPYTPQWQTFIWCVATHGSFQLEVTNSDTLDTGAACTLSFSSGKQILIITFSDLKFYFIQLGLKPVLWRQLGKHEEHLYSMFAWQ